MGEGLARARTLTDAIRELAANDGDASAVTIESRSGTTRFSRRELGALAATYAAGLREVGVASGDRVVMAHPTSPAFLGGFWGCQAIGAVAVPVAPVSSGKPDSAEGRRLRVVLERARPAALLADDDVLEVAASFGGGADWAVAHPVPDAALDDVLGRTVDGGAPAVIQFTSGSTSDPRGCVLTHDAIVANLAAVQHRLDIFHPMVGVNWCPLYHDMGLIGGVALPVWSGYLDLVYQPTTEFVFNPLSWLRLMSTHRAEISSAPNFAFALVVRRLENRPLPDVDLSSVRSVFNGAEPIDPAVARRFCELLAPCGFSPRAMHPAYGLAEHVVIVASSAGGVRTRAVERRALEDAQRVRAAAEPDDAIDIVSLGSPVRDVEVRIVGGDGEPLAPDAIGEVEVRSAAIMSGYFEDPTATAAVLRDGWLRTGDLGFVDEAGDLFLVGRAKDLIIVGGRNFYAYDIERAASGIPSVRTNGAAAFGVAHASGEAVVVVVESRTKEPASVVAEVRAACNDEVGVAVRDVAIVKPGALPRTSSGKIQRQLTRQRYLSGALDTPPTKLHPEPATPG